MTIVGVEAHLSVDESDDDFHRPTTDDPTWIETAWFPFWLPELGASGSARLWFRPNEGVQGGAVHVLRGEGQVLAHDGWTEPFTGFGDLRDLRLANGFHLACVEPLAVYRVRHTSTNLDLDLTFRALMEPNPVDPSESPGMFLGQDSRDLVDNVTGLLSRGATSAAD